LANPAPIDEEVVLKIVAMIRHIAAQTGEAAAAAQLLPRVLQNAGAEVVTAIADRIQGNSPLSEREMQEVFDAGVKTGIKQAKQKLRSNQEVTVQFPSARDMALFCYRNLAELRSDWEIEFITNMAAWTRTRPLSVKQQAHLEKIYIKLHGRI
jgi:hypothetical protein